MSTVGASTDYAVLLLARGVFDLPPATATGLGLTVGSTVSFWLNRRFTFVDSQGAALNQALRFALTVSMLVVIHSSAVSILCGSFALHVVLAKAIADITVMPVPQTFLMRRFVFPARRSHAPLQGAVAVTLESRAA